MPAPSISFDSRPKPGAAREHLAAVVANLTRARALQILVECAWGGLFWGLLVSTVVMLSVRLGRLAYPAWAIVGGSLALAMIVAAVGAWRRRPDDLQVAILTDLRLNLKERVSTAWEFARAAPDDGLTARLAAQAVWAVRRPNPRRVFPLRMSNWGRLTPVAATLLVLVSLVDPPGTAEPQVMIGDEGVAAEGSRLREYGRRLEGRARREGLRRSVEASQSMQHLGSRMESATLSRRRALNRLRDLGATLDEEELAALRDAVELDVGPLELVSSATSPLARIARLRSRIQALLDGSSARGQAESLSGDEDGLTGIGISAAELERALEDFSTGDPQELRRILDALTRLDRALRDAQELGDAGQAVDRARDNLGAADLPSGRQGEAPGTASNQGEGRMGARRGDDGGPTRSKKEGDPTTGDGSGFSPDGTSRGRQSRGPTGTEPRGQIIKPEARLGEGLVFRSEARVLPRAGQPTVEAVELDPSYAAQLEGVLAKEVFPLHYKEFIRRYFLALSEGVHADPSPDRAPHPVGRP